jgi:hypothetical protein
MAIIRLSWPVVKSAKFVVMGDGLMPGELWVNNGNEAFHGRCLFEPSGVQKPAVGLAGDAPGRLQSRRPRSPHPGG